MPVTEGLSVLQATNIHHIFFGKVKLLDLVGNLFLSIKPVYLVNVLLLLFFLGGGCLPQ